VKFQNVFITKYIINIRLLHVIIVSVDSLSYASLPHACVTSPLKENLFFSRGLIKLHFYFHFKTILFEK